MNDPFWPQFDYFNFFYLTLMKYYEFCAMEHLGVAAIKKAANSDSYDFINLVLVQKCVSLNGHICIKPHCLEFGSSLKKVYFSLSSAVNASWHM